MRMQTGRHRQLRITRGALLKRGAAAGGGVAAGALLLRSASGQAQSKARDAEILNFALQLEHVKAAFYAEAYDRALIVGRLRQYARVVGGHEQRHVEFLQRQLGSAAKPAPKVRFGDATGDPRAFLESAQRIEDLALRAYTGQGANLTAAALAAAARIVSVEARHAAWVRDLAGENPAPDAAEPLLTADQVIEQLEGTGFLA
jgi:hypothetical protein